MQLAGTGIWSAALRYGDRADASAAAAELESLGYTAVWIPDVGGNLFQAVRELLEATDTLVVATGILNLWMHDPSETNARYGEFAEAFGPRFLVGIGASHAPLIDKGEPGRYRMPLTRVREYLDALDAGDTPVPPSERVLAALGPKMLELSRDRAAGAHPYLVTPEHTAQARAILGQGPLLAPEQAVVLSTDPDEARERARTHLSGYLMLPNYRNNLLRLGFDEADVDGGGSDRLVDTVVVWGDEEAIAARVAEHRTAGADHVCIQVLTGDVSTFPLETWRRLAKVLV